MAVDWNEINDRRIGEKTLELKLYCSRRRDEMTPRAFELARKSLSVLLDNILERNWGFPDVPCRVGSTMTTQNEYVAICSENEAKNLARTIVYKSIGDDLNLYPITAEGKLQRSKIRGFGACSIPADEMTFKDCMYVVYAIMKGENFSPETARACFNRFEKHNMTPLMARVYAGIYYNNGTAEIASLPQFSKFISEYRGAAKELASLGFLHKNDNDVYSFTEKRPEQF